MNLILQPVTEAAMLYGKTYTPKIYCLYDEDSLVFLRGGDATNLHLALVALRRMDDPERMLQVLVHLAMLESVAVAAAQQDERFKPFISESTALALQDKQSELEDLMSIFFELQFIWRTPLIEKDELDRILGRELAARAGIFLQTFAKSLLSGNLHIENDFFDSEHWAERKQVTILPLSAFEKGTEEYRKHEYLCKFYQDWIVPLVSEDEYS